MQTQGWSSLAAQCGGPGSNLPYLPRRLPSWGGGGALLPPGGRALGEAPRSHRRPPSWVSAAGLPPGTLKAPPPSWAQVAGEGPRIEGCRSCGVGLLALGEDSEGAGT